MNAPIAIGYVGLVVVSLGVMVWLSPVLSLVALVVLAAAGILTVQNPPCPSPGCLVGSAKCR